MYGANCGDGAMTMTAANTALTERACWRLLGTAEVGRLCYTESALPVIRAVPFVVDGARVVIALSLAVVPSGVFTRPMIVAFEAGEWVPGEHRGWSVQLVGRATPVRDAVRFGERDLTAWIGGGAPFYVTVTAGVVTGQQVAG
jgi:uncharacterized protein